MKHICSSVTAQNTSPDCEPLHILSGLHRKGFKVSRYPYTMGTPVTLAVKFQNEYNSRNPSVLAETPMDKMKTSLLLSCTEEQRRRLSKRLSFSYIHTSCIHAHANSAIKKVQGFYIRKNVISNVCLVFVYCRCWNSSVKVFYSSRLHLSLVPIGNLEWTDILLCDL